MTSVSRRRATSKDSVPFGKRIRDGDTCQAQIVHRNTIPGRIANAGPPFRRDRDDEKNDVNGVPLRASPALSQRIKARSNTARVTFGRIDETSVESMRSNMPGLLARFHHPIGSSRPNHIGVAGFDRPEVLRKVKGVGNVAAEHESREPRYRECLDRLISQKQTPSRSRRE